jgi:hypothetical protein
MTIKIEKMNNVPPKANPLHHDTFSQGTQINDRFMAMYVNYQENVLVIVDMLTGERRRMTFTPAEKVQSVKPKKTASREHPGISSWVDIKA